MTDVLVHNTVALQYPALNLMLQARLDPVLVACSELLGISFSDQSYLLGQLLIFAVSYGYLSLVLRLKVHQAVAGFFFTLGMFAFVVGLDPFYLSVQWFPLLLAACVSLKRDQRSLSLLMMLIATVLWTLTAGGMAFFGALIAVLTLLVTERDGYRSAGLKRFYSRAAYFFSFALLLLSIFLLPVYEMPDYPGSARLTGVSPLSFAVPPLIGPWISPLSILYDQLETLLMARTVRLLVLTGVVLLFVFKFSERRDTLKNLAAGFSLLLLVFIAELVVDKSFLAYTPFQFLRRAIPGLALSELPWMLLPCSFVLIGLFVARAMPKRSSVALALVVVGLGALGSTAQLSDRLGIGVLADVDGKHCERLATARNGDWLEAVRYSPSRFLLETYGNWVSEKGRANNELERIDLRSALASSDAERNEERKHLALDGDKATRWSTASPQSAGNWFAIELSEETTVRRIVLSTTASPFDFPRGIRVVATGEEERELFSQPTWFGALRWTPKGYPYFGAQADVTIELPEAVSVRGLRFEQTSSHDTFDWSIHEVELYR